jgi:hypothetical protein
MFGGILHIRGTVRLSRDAAAADGTEGKSHLALFRGRRMYSLPEDISLVL